MSHRFGDGRVTALDAGGEVVAGGVVVQDCIISYYQLAFFRSDGGAFNGLASHCSHRFRRRDGVELQRREPLRQPSLKSCQSARFLARSQTLRQARLWLLRTGVERLERQSRA